MILMYCNVNNKLLPPFAGDIILYQTTVIKKFWIFLKLKLVTFQSWIKSIFLLLVCSFFDFFVSVYKRTRFVDFSKYTAECSLHRPEPETLLPPRKGWPESDPC